MRILIVVLVVFGSLLLVGDWLATHLVSDSGHASLPNRHHPSTNA